MARTENDAAAARRLVRLDNDYLWHPFTAMRQWQGGGAPGRAGDEDAGRVIVAGEGFYLIDARGRRYIDGFSSLWCNVHGHRVARIDAAVRHQLQKIAHSSLLGHASPPSIALAQRLVRITPEGLNKVFYSDSGSTAVEIALKMAFGYWRNIGRGREKFLAVRHGYHGDTLGSVSVGGIDTFHKVFSPLLFDTTLVDSPNSYVNPAGADAGGVVLAQVDSALSAAPGKYCAVIMEPLIQAAGGMLTHPPGFLAGMRQITTKHDVLLIVDEVATGFCRTGRLFACEHEDVQPDLMCLGKGLSGGYLPVAATLATTDIFDAFCGEGATFYHGHTFTGNALGCAAAVASVDLILESGLLDMLAGKVERIHTALAELADHPHVAEVRQCGMMVGIGLVRDRATGEPFDPARRVGAAVCRSALARGVITRSLGDVVVLMPAPAMDGETLGKLLTATIETINEYFRLNAI